MSTSLYTQAIEQFEQKKYKKVEKILSKIKNKNLNELKLELQNYYNLAKYTKAEMLLSKIVTLTDQSDELAEVYFFVGICVNNLNKKESAIKYLEKSIAYNSTIGNRYAVFNLFCLYFQQENYTQLDKLANKLLKWDEFYLRVLVTLAKSFAKREKKNKLVELTRKIIPHVAKLDEEDFIEVSRYVFSTELISQSEFFISNYEKENGVIAHSVRADSLFHQGKYQEVVNYLTLDLLERIHTSALYYLKSSALDKIKKFSESYEYLSIASRLKLKELGEKKKDLLNSNFNKLLVKPDFISFLGNQTRKCSDKTPIVFIFGFPRSGTTLIDNIIETQSRALVLSEKDIISAVIEKFKSLNKKFPQDILKLTEKEINLLRDYYYQCVTSMGFIIPENGIIIDKGPHHTEVLPFISLLFPQAKLVTVIRHPLDTCLSCVQQNFIANNFNDQLITIEQTVERYLEVFHLLEKYNNRLVLDVLDVKYEDLINNFDESVLRLLTFLNLDVENTYQHFHKLAAQKYVTSASRGQTDKALYKDSMYKWHNYYEQLLPYKEKLSYFIEKFGYQDK